MSAAAKTPNCIAHRSGFEAGQAQARTEAAERTAKTLLQIADSMDRIHQALTGIETKLETEAVQVAVAVAAKLAPELIAREPFTEISALATEAFRQLVTTPQIAVHIGADIFESAKDKLERYRTYARLRRPPGRAARRYDGARRLPDRMGRWRRHSRPRGNDDSYR